LENDGFSSLFHFVVVGFHVCFDEWADTRFKKRKLVNKIQKKKISKQDHPHFFSIPANLQAMISPACSRSPFPASALSPGLSKETGEEV
jgi:hypothetical protein